MRYTGASLADLGGLRFVGVYLGGAAVLSLVALVALPCRADADLDVAAPGPAADRPAKSSL